MGRGGAAEGDDPHAARGADANTQDAADHREVQGDTLVVGFVLSLLAFTVVTFGTAWYFLDPSDRGVLSFPFLRLVSSAVSAVVLLIAVGAYRKHRNGWWIYILLALVPVVNLVVAVAWFVRLRSRPVRLGRFMV